MPEQEAKHYSGQGEKDRVLEREWKDQQRRIVSWPEKSTDRSSASEVDVEGMETSGEIG
jgi:hypothetical protein